MSSDNALWRAVIQQALTDAVVPLSRVTAIRLEQMRAREWFIQPNRDFEEVCGLAGLEPDQVRDRARKAIDAAEATPVTDKRRRHKLYELRGKQMTLDEWARVTGINKVTIYDRLKRGWTIEAALTTPAHQRARKRQQHTPGVGPHPSSFAPDRRHSLAQESLKTEFFR